MTFNHECSNQPKPAADSRRSAEAALARAVERLYRLGVEEEAMARLRDALADVLSPGLVYVPWARALAWDEVTLEPWQVPGPDAFRPVEDGDLLPLEDGDLLPWP